MNKIQYSHRQYRPGDEDAINTLYFRVTGRTRTREQWAWQWLQAPAGAGDMWLIEATHPDGRVELIGHHGIMPIRFTSGDNDLLFGKTENTMVLPEYRQKILYPRFERRFAKEYETRYHALFSTMGPAAAIRQRKAMGYTAENHWLNLEHAYWPWGSFVRAAQHPRLAKLQKLANLLFQPNFNKHMPEGVVLLTAKEAREDEFLKSYWNNARKNWGVSPSRAAEDLAWRYWDNPYSARYAVIVRHPSVGSALIIIEHSAPGVAKIEDFSTEKPCSKALVKAIELAMLAVKNRLNVRVITCGLTSDTLTVQELAALHKVFRSSLISKLYQKFRPSAQSFMPRKVTEKGLESGLSNKSWGITMAITEGRR